MKDDYSDWERYIADNFHPDVLMGRRPHGKRIWLVFVNDGPLPQQNQPPPALVLIRGGKQD